MLCDALAFADADQPGSDHRLRHADGRRARRLGTGAAGAVRHRRAGGRGPRARLPPLEHDPLWPMPLWMGYDDELGSKIADLNNVAASGLAGAIFGALVPEALRDRDGALAAPRPVCLESQGASRAAGSGPRRRRFAASTAIYLNATVRCDHEEENQGSPQGRHRQDAVRRPPPLFPPRGRGHQAGARRAPCCTRSASAKATSTSRRSASPRPGAT